MFVLYAAAVLTAMFFVWQMNVRRMEKLGRGWFVRNWLALTISGIIGLILAALFGSDDPTFQIGGFAIVAAVLLTRFPLKKNKALQATPVPDKVQTETDALNRIGGKSGVRQRSLDAMKRATVARQRDIAARGEKPAESINVFDPPRIVRGERLDKVRFDYLNAKGEYSSRRVLVQMVGEWEFEGIDLDKENTRTFRYERVIGDIMSLNTGEILDPEEWRDGLR